jgi:hypothetical protein
MASKGPQLRLGSFSFILGVLWLEKGNYNLYHNIEGFCDNPLDIGFTPFGDIVYEM